MTRSIILLVAMLSLSLCAYADQAISLPNKKSELDGWQGIKIRKGGACGPKCCTLEFPKEFGCKDKTQLAMLKSLVKNSHNFVHDVDCWMPINYFALKRLRSLALERQDADAASFLLDRSSHSELNLDGELEAEYSGEYEIPVLEHYKNLESIITDKNAVLLSESICAWAKPRNESDRIGKLIGRLTKEGQNVFADLLRKKCNLK